MKLAFTLIALVTLGTSTHLGAEESENNLKEELIEQIIDIAKANTGKVDQAEETEEEIQPLIDALLEITPERSEAEKSSQVAGAWRNLWSNTAFGPGTNYDQVYQIVSTEGYYYNVSETKLGRLSFTSFLRGEYVDEGTQLGIRFTSNAIRYGFYPAGTALVTLTTDFEKGDIPSINVPGPIGVTGDLANVYVDDKLRIVVGAQDGQEDRDIFILERTETILP